MAYAVSLNNDDEDEGDDPEFSGEGDDDEKGGANSNDFPDFSAVDGRTFRDPNPDSTQSQIDLDAFDDADALETQEKGGDMSG
jgi:hypothetical protein